MTISGFSNAIVSAMLGWLKGLANWVLRLFNLAGSVSVSPLAWLSQNWLKLLIVFMVIGVTIDLLVWLIRWRPHWVWFRKERVIVNDDRFFSEEDIKSEREWEEDLEKNWHEREYVVASTVVKRREGGNEKSHDKKRRRALSDEEPSTKVRRFDGGDGKRDRHDEESEMHGSFRRSARRSKPGIPSERRDLDSEEKGRLLMEERESELFTLDGDRVDVTDFYEDEVFNVSNLPSPDDRSRSDAE